VEIRLIALKLLLNELDVELNIEDISDRIRIQKTVYLAQEAGVNLDYRYSWYIHGPYAPALAGDYYNLRALVLDDQASVENKNLTDSAKENLRKIKSIFSSPSQDLKNENWLELLSSYHFLRVKSGYDHAAANKVLQDKKPDLVPYIEQARTKLVEIGLLS
jgi:uncharacterized protein YwgA